MYTMLCRGGIRTRFLDRRCRRSHSASSAAPCSVKSTKRPSQSPAFASSDGCRRTPDRNIEIVEHHHAAEWRGQRGDQKPVIAPRDLARDRRRGVAAEAVGDEPFARAPPASDCRRGSPGSHQPSRSSRFFRFSRSRAAGSQHERACRGDAQIALRYRAAACRCRRTRRLARPQNVPAVPLDRSQQRFGRRTQQIAARD